MTKTDAGRWIEVKPLDENADRSIRDNCERAPKEIDLRDMHWEKQDSQMTETDAGR
jgi:hypothetical protein